MSGECSWLSEGDVAQVAPEGADVKVAPVVHDQAGALGEDALAVLVLTDEVGGVAVVIPIKKFNLLVGTGKHCL